MHVHFRQICVCVCVCVRTRGRGRWVGEKAVVVVTFSSWFKTPTQYTDYSDKMSPAPEGRRTRGQAKSTVCWTVEGDLQSLKHIRGTIPASCPQQTAAFIIYAKWVNSHFQLYGHTIKLAHYDIQTLLFCLHLKLFWIADHRTLSPKVVHHVCYFDVDADVLCTVWLEPVSLGPKYMGIPRVNAQGLWNQTVWILQWAIYYTVKHHLETVLYKHLCYRGFKVSCAVYRVYWVERGCWPSLCLHLTQSAVPFVQIVATVCLQGRDSPRFFYDMCNTWYMVLGPWVNLICWSLNQSECLPTPPFDWGKLVYSVANHNPGLMRRALSK